MIALLTSIFSFVGIYCLRKQYDYALTTSLFILSFLTIMHYSFTSAPTIINMVSVIGIFLFMYTYFRKIRKYPLHKINFILISYIFISCLEHLNHKYVMHCKEDNIITKIAENIPFIKNEFKQSCRSHTQHHLDTEPDMTLNQNTFYESMFMGWGVFLQIFTQFFIGFTLSNYITSAKVKIYILLIASIISVFIWSYIWNKVHTEMHKYEHNYSIAEGPYDNGIFDLTWLTKLLYHNHVNHHLQKGEKKGNFNVIVLVADYWFNNHNKVVDNEEYCKTHDEKICQKK